MNNIYRNRLNWAIAWAMADRQTCPRKWRRFAEVAWRLQNEFAEKGGYLLPTARLAERLAAKTLSR